MDNLSFSVSGNTVTVLVEGDDLEAFLTDSRVDALVGMALGLLPGTFSEVEVEVVL